MASLSEKSGSAGAASNSARRPGGGVRISARMLGAEISRRAGEPRVQGEDQYFEALSRAPDRRQVTPVRGTAGAAVVNDVAEALGHSPALMARGREVLGLCGDPLRRRVIERLADIAGIGVAELIEDFGASRADIDNRLVTLRRAEVIRKGKFATYRLDPDALLGIRAYFDVLVAASSLSGGALRREP